jgi:hypothetical protein
VYNADMQDREKEGYWYITIGDVFNQELSVPGFALKNPPKKTQKTT